jgi:hypothetical protein
MNRNLNRRIHPIAEADGLSPKKPRNNRTNYDDYIKSPQWRQIRAMMLNRFGKCQLCSSTQNLEVHHNSYEHIGCEKEHLEDLVVLCHDCHAVFHNKR